MESKSVIATACDLPNAPTSGNLIEFPITLPFTVTLLDEMSDGSSAYLYDCTRTIIDDFDPSKVSTCAISVDPRRGHEKLGLKVEVPLYQSLSDENLFGTYHQVAVEEEGGEVYALLTREGIEPAAMGGRGADTGAQAKVGTDCSGQESRSQKNGRTASSVDAERISTLELRLEVRREEGGETVEGGRVVMVLSNVTYAQKGVKTSVLLLAKAGS